MRFLLVEDNAKLAAAVQNRLAMDGHVVDWSADLAAAEHCLSITDYDLIFLDISLPDGDGSNLLRSMRRARRETPVIVLTARGEIADRVRMLDAGADDYMIKPFDVAELEARCRAVLRRKRGEAVNVIHLGDVIFDPLAATMTVDGHEIDLRNRELRLLEIFAQSPERVFSKSHLADRLFSYDEDASENAIEVYVGRLRKKLEGGSVRIETVRGVGYRMRVE